jgi:rubrerythrin
MASPRKAGAKKSAARKTAKPKVKTKKAAVVEKTATKKASAAKQEIKKGSKLACQVCGFAVTVDRLCGCAEEAHLICCGTPMKVKGTRV